MSETTPLPPELQQAKPNPRAGWRKAIDIAEVERLASLGMPLGFIAKAVGVCADTMTNRLKERSSDVSEAYENGIHQARVSVLQSLKTGMEKSFIPAIFLAKQPHILGFQDVQTKQHVGEIKLVIEERVIHEDKSQIAQAKETAEDAG